MTRIEDDEALLVTVTQAVEAAGSTLMARFGTTPAPTTLPDLLAGIAANDAAVETDLRDTLLAALPGSQWAADEEEEGALPAGEWWVVDPAEGNVNHLHGRPGWAVTATLVRDGEPVLAIVTVPLTGDTYTALAGRGAFLNGVPVTVSAKQDLAAAIVASGQASPGEPKAIRAAMIRSAGKLLDAALLVRLSVVGHARTYRGVTTAMMSAIEEPTKRLNANANVGQTSLASSRSFADMPLKTKWFERLIVRCGS